MEERGGEKMIALANFGPNRPVLNQAKTRPRCTMHIDAAKLVGIIANLGELIGCW